MEVMEIINVETLDVAAMEVMEFIDVEMLDVAVPEPTCGSYNL